MNELNKNPYRTKLPLLRKIKLRLICIMALFVYRLLTITYRVKYVGIQHVNEAMAMHPKGSFVYGLWHEYFFSSVCTHAFRGVSPMISQSNDGEIISYIATKLGFTPVRGSTSRGGEDARSELYSRINSGLHAAFTADGPRGPRHKMKSGLIDLARQGQMAIVPLGFAASRAWVLHKSWDQSLIPKPFSKLVVAYGEPISIAANCHGADFAAAKKQVAEALNKIGDVAKHECNGMH